MRIIALCGAAGAGKDTVADMLPSRKIAFSDALYEEVAEAFNVKVEWLKDRQNKEVRKARLAPTYSSNENFFQYARDILGFSDEGLLEPKSPRQALQWWGDYRRAQDPDYFVRAVRESMRPYVKVPPAYVITDVRFPNEAAMARQLGGQIWQIRRTGYEAGGTGHASDTAGDEFNPDLVIDNNGTLMSLSQKVLDAWRYSFR